MAEEPGRGREGPRTRLLAFPGQDSRGGAIQEIVLMAETCMDLPGSAVETVVLTLDLVDYELKNGPARRQ